MSKKKPPSRSRVLPFPSLAEDRPKLPESRRAAAKELETAWEAELLAIEAEPPGRRCRLTLPKPAGLELLGFLAPTGLGRLILVQETETHLLLVSDRQTITRLVVWRCLELDLDFAVEFLDQP